eukprot:jgi/Orpsp1_1/1175198/evm.model.c7180000052986.1
MCQVINCELFKNVQGVLRPSDISNYPEYSKTIYSNYKKALSNEITADNAIQIIFNFAE